MTEGTQIEGLRREVASLQQRIIELEQQAENARQHQELLQGMIDAIPAGMLIKDTYGRFLLANNYVTTSAGKTPAEVIGKTAQEILSPEEAWAAHKREQQVVATGQPVAHEINLSVADRQLVILSTSFPIRNAQGKIYAVGALGLDITERKQQEQELRLAQFALDRAVDPICWKDFDGNFCYVNDAMCKSLGYTRAELLTMNILDIDREMPREVARKAWDSLRQQPVIVFEAMHTRKDESVFPAAVTAYYLEFNGTEYIVSMTRDITEQKRREEERAAMQQQIIDAQRETLRELSTPLLPIAEDVVIMPLVGTIDSQRAQMVMETLLDGIARYQTRLVILDITGVQIVDSQVANALIHAAQAARLLGARVMLTGIQPAIAQTLVHLGIDLSDIITQGSLQSGVAYALAHTTGKPDQPGAQI